MHVQSLRRIGGVALAVAAAAASQPAMAQTVTLDEGTFRIMVGGREVGTETFTIRQNGSGADAVIIARGRVTLDSNETTSSLQLAGGTLRPAAYDVKLEGADGRQIAGRVVGGRFSARIVSPAGENMREYLVSDGAIVVDDGIAHHYYFLGRRGGDGRVPIVIPQESKQVVAEVSMGGMESVTVGGQSLQGRRMTVRPAGGTERTVWLDGEGRVLRVEVPSSRYVAERTAPPG